MSNRFYDIVYPNDARGIKGILGIGGEDRQKFIQRIYNDDRFKVIQIVEFSVYEHGSGSSNRIYAIVEKIK